MNELHLFAGAGGGILGGILLGHTPVCAVEIEPYCRKVLLQRQKDGHLPWFPIWDDVRTFNGYPWRGIADIVCGGFPCQDISNAGLCAGIEGEKSGLWNEMRRIIHEVRPAFVFVENVAALLVRGIDKVLADLASLGFNVEWGVFSSCAFGASHTRERVFILAYANSIGCSGSCFQRQQPGRTETLRTIQNAIWEKDASELCRIDYGMANRLDRLKSVGNGQDGRVASKAFSILMQRAAGTICAGRAAAGDSGTGQHSMQHSKAGNTGIAVGS
jgi:DNA (cytosine-5)-methyltransferase 1